MGSCCATSWGKPHSQGPVEIFLWNLTFATFPLWQTGWEGQLQTGVSASLSSSAELSQDWRQPAFKNKSCKEAPCPFCQCSKDCWAWEGHWVHHFMAVRVKSGYSGSSGTFPSFQWEHTKDDSGQEAADAGLPLKMIHRKRMHLAFQGSSCFHTLQN